MFENIIKFFKKANKKEALNASSKETAKERLHLVLMQDRANVSADFLDLMRQEIIEVIKKYIDIDEKSMDVRLTNQENEDGTQGAPALYANIPIVNIKEKARNAKKEIEKEKKEEEKVENKVEEKNDAVDEETKEVEEKAKKIVKEENSSHNTNKENKKLVEDDKKESDTTKKMKKESENE